MNPWNDGDTKDVSYDALCEADRFDQTGESICGFEGIVDGEAWIPRIDGDETTVRWVCPQCGASHESFAFVGDLVW